MKKILILGMILASVKLCSIPIIFLNGNKAEGVDTVGFLTWNDTLKELESDPVYYSSMHQVSGYKGYGLSPILDCNKYTELPSGLSDKTLFNFTYYDTASIRGVISMSAESVIVYFKTYFTLNMKNENLIFMPFMEDYPIAHSDSIKYVPRYLMKLKEVYYYDEYSLKKGFVLTQKGIEYIESWKTNRYAEDLCRFIDKVLIATGSNQVNIVAHSMGGLVTRVAVIGYNYKEKINKVITLSSPHKPLEADAEELYT